MGVRGRKGRSRGDPEKIHRSREFSVQECWRKYGKEDQEGGCWYREQGMRIRVRGGLGDGGGKGETRTVECGGVLGSLSKERQGEV